jgi:hypothetical protein
MVAHVVHVVCCVELGAHDDVRVRVHVVLSIKYASWGRKIGRERRSINQGLTWMFIAQIPVKNSITRLVRKCIGTTNSMMT